MHCVCVHPSRSAEEALVEVESNQKMLEREVKVKKITVNIDKNKCLPLRAIFKFDMKTKLDSKELPYSWAIRVLNKDPSFEALLNIHFDI